MPSLSRAPTASGPSIGPAAPSVGAPPPAVDTARVVDQARGNAFAAEQLATSQAAGPASAAPAVGPAAAQSAGPAAAQEAGAVAGPAAAQSAGPAAGARPASGALARLPNPDPVVEGEISQEVLGVRIVGRGVSPTAVEACARFVNATLASRPDIQDRLEAEKVVLVIIPRGKPMTDVAEFAGLRGGKTFDGRLWSDVRGSGGMRVPSGEWAIGVPEENLVDTGTDADKYGEGYNVGLHEFAHTIQLKGLGEAERAKVETLYTARAAAGGPWTEAYGASNAQEYYAQGTNCFFGANARVGNNGPEWLERNDPELYALLVGVYGAPARTAPAVAEGPAAAPAAPAPAAPTPAPAASGPATA